MQYPELGTGSLADTTVTERQQRVRKGLDPSCQCPAGLEQLARGAFHGCSKVPGGDEGGDFRLFQEHLGNSISVTASSGQKSRAVVKSLEF